MLCVKPGVCVSVRELVMSYSQVVDVSHNYVIGVGKRVLCCCPNLWDPTEKELCVACVLLM